MDSTANNYNANATMVDDVGCTFDKVEDEVPGFGLLSAVAAIGVVLLLRRRN
jgi:PGF-CTERM protein